jgi:propanol-preferring alcohol dehydrogenase
VVAVGPGVGHLREGDRVGVPWLYSACGHCVHCLGGWETLCEQQINTRVGRESLRTRPDLR